MINKKEPSWDLIAPSGKTAASVFLYSNNGFGHCWFVWDENGIGGENSIEKSIGQAKITAESAVLRWGKHFKCNQRRGRKRREEIEHGS